MALAWDIVLMTYTANLTTTDAEYVVVHDSNHDPRLHRSDCRDIKRDGGRIIGRGTSPQAAAEDAFDEMIEDGDIDASQALRECVVLPCAG